MKCPYCGKELQSGTVSEIGTGTNGAPAFMSRIFYPENNTGKHSGINVGHFTNAYYCANCHKVFGELSAE